MDKVSVGVLAKYLHITIDELTKKAGELGIVIISEENYFLQDDELKKISAEAFEIVAEKGWHAISPKVKRKKKEKKTVITTRIGVVKFFDRYKDFGFIISNNLNEANYNAKSSQLTSYHFTASCCSDPFPPSDNCWVSFKTEGKKTIEVSLLKKDLATLTLALKYRGPYSSIVGTDYHADKHYDINILKHVIRMFQGEKVSIVKVFCDYLSQQSEECIDIVIGQFLQDPILVKELLPLFSLPIHEFDFSEDTYNHFKDAINESVFDSNDISAFELLPKDFDFSSRKDKVCGVLLRNAENKAREVMNWLKSNMQFVMQLRLDRKDIQTIPLRNILVDVTDNVSWVQDTDFEWKELVNWIANVENDILILLFISHFFRNRDSAFVNEHSLTSHVSTQRLKKIAQYLFGHCKENQELLKDLINYIVDKDSELISQCVGNDDKGGIDFVDKDFNLLSQYVSTQSDLSHLYPKLGKYLNQQHENNPDNVRNLLYKMAGKADFSILFPSTESYKDTFYEELFIASGEKAYQDIIENSATAAAWLQRQSDKIILEFIQKYVRADIDVDIARNFLTQVGNRSLHSGLILLGLEDQHLLLRSLPRDIAQSLVFEYFADSKLVDLFTEDLFVDLQKSVPYIVFDLESDGDSIEEFAYVKEGKTEYCRGESKLRSLIDDLGCAKLIVGHRIKQWDIPILKRKGLETHATVWDTLEMELLITPCRYAYSLHTTHHANDDAELTDRLFWNQLFRLAVDSSLRNELSAFIPDIITDIIERLCEPIFKSITRNISGSEDVFFQKLQKLDDRLVRQLNDIENTTGDDKVLIVAPERLWKRISDNVTVSFPRITSGDTLFPISSDKLKDEPVEDPFVQTVLLRFAKTAKTPIVSNLSQYFRINYGSKFPFGNYITNKTERIQCVDLSILKDDSESFLSKYKYVYFVGCELENRMNQYEMPFKLKPSIFWDNAELNSIPMRLASCSYTALSMQERQSPIFTSVPKEAYNVLIERNGHGEYIVVFNYNFGKKIEKIIDALKGTVTCQIVPWLMENTPNDHIYLVKNSKSTTYNYSDNRVSYTSPFRSSYWVYQLTLLNDVKIHNNGQPIVYILDNDVELENVIGYVQSLGFYVPKEGTLVKKLEKIALHSNGLLVIDRKSFYNVVEWSKDNAYCFIWDQVAVERYRLMWKNPAADQQDDLLNDDVEEDGYGLNKTCNGDTYQSTLLDLWPIYKYYCSLVKQNNAESTVYFLDPFFDEYHSLSSIWKIGVYTAKNLWQDENEFMKSLNDAKKYFQDSESDPFDDSDVDKAMRVIFNILVKDPSAPKRKWKPVQEEVLPKILSKKENYLVSMPTGGGKSVLFQGPAIYRSAYSKKLSIVITPLKALMEDQVSDLAKKGFVTNVEYLNGDRSLPETRSIYQKIRGGEIALLYLTPERFRSRAFIDALEMRNVRNNGLEYIVFDEAHCISQWGMEFRPDYLHALDCCLHYNDKACIALFSATVSQMIFTHISAKVQVKQIGDKIGENPIREHIGVDFQKINNDIQSREKKIVEIISRERINRVNSRILIFCQTRRNCEVLAQDLPRMLADAGIIDPSTADKSVDFFHAGLNGDDRADVIACYKDSENPLYILCATKAFGMGMDIPNIHLVVHLSPPQVFEDYLQEVGRAGRNEDMYKACHYSTSNPIPTVCLYSEEDIKELRTKNNNNSLSWAKLESIRSEIADFITPIQSIDETKEIPIVIPNNLWKDGNDESSTTNFRLGLHWLEQLDRIKLGFLSPIRIVIKLCDSHNSNKSYESEELDDSLFSLFEHINGRSPKSNDLTDDKSFLQNPDDNPIFKTAVGENGLTLLKILKKISEERNNKTIQVSLQQLRRTMSLTINVIIDLMLFLVRHGYIEIVQETLCRISRKRYDETPYILEHQYSDFAFGIIINAVNTLLADTKLKSESVLEYSDVKNSIGDLSFLNSLLIDCTRTNDKGEIEIAKYMPWYNPDDKDKNEGLSLAKSYKADLLKNRIKQIYTLMDIIPGVKIKSYLDTNDNRIKQSIYVQNNAWKDFLPRFKDDCYKVLKHIYDICKSNSAPKLNWGTAITKLNLVYEESHPFNSGFNYFSDILRFFRGMAYIVMDPLLPTGVELRTTNRFCDSIDENIKDEHPDYKFKVLFRDLADIKRYRLNVMDILTRQVRNPRDFRELVSAYFTIQDKVGFLKLLEKYYKSDDPIWKEIQEEAIKNSEQKLNQQQLEIYNEASNQHVNVEAGPGSGKTHLLTLKCAKLIYKENTPSSQILVLAYNRAVVEELKERLSKMFAELGLSRSASRLNILTFSSFAKRVCGHQALKNVALRDWEDHLLSELRYSPEKTVLKAFPLLKYVLIDEFQDINQTRLNCMFELQKIYDNLFFFTIGDKDQSIYGFEKKESIDPNFYYKQLYEHLNPKKKELSINYRSYPQILEFSKRFLPNNSTPPSPCPSNLDKISFRCVYEPEISSDNNWIAKFPSAVDWFKKQGFNDVAIFFRTNDEVYYGYSFIKSLNIPNVSIRIQGASNCELFRVREIYTVIRYLECFSSTQIDSAASVKQFFFQMISQMMTTNPCWDRFYLDFAYVMILSYLDTAVADETPLTFGDMAEYIKSSLSEENPQTYKLYSKYQNERIDRDKKFNVILTTMHKVKGLEFDAVIVTPSRASLPYNPIGSRKGTIDQFGMSHSHKRDEEIIEEERRLLYVACTRAKYFLSFYWGGREKAVERLGEYEGSDEILGIREKEPGIGNYNIGYNASWNYRNNNYIGMWVRKNDPVKVCKRESRDRRGCIFHVYDIYHNGNPIGQLSQSSSIYKKMEDNNLSELNGYYVSEVYCWSFQDTLTTDSINHEDNASKWSPAARDNDGSNNGYIYIVEIAGYGN